MGMYGHLRQIAPAELEKLQLDSEAVEEFIHGKIRATAPNVKAALERVQKIALEARASGKASNPAEQEKLRAQVLKELEGVGARLQDGPSEDGLRLEKSWHVLHYLLTGKTEEAPPPLGNAILGGQEIGEDRDYGRVRCLIPKQVREVAAALAKISKDDLVRRVDLRNMTAAKVIYPCRDQSEVELAQHYYEHMARYYADAAANGNAMLLYID
jgi:Domain of unknown function (DUF1877)